MTCRGDRKASERKSGIGEDEKQLSLARVADRWRRSKLVILVTLMKENHSSEAYVKTDRRKALYRTERDFLEGPHKEAEIQRNGLRRGKNLTYSKDTCLENKSAVERDPKKSWNEIETETGVEQEEVGLEISLVGIH